MIPNNLRNGLNRADENLPSRLSEVHLDSTKKVYGGFRVFKASGELCPSGSRHLTYWEAFGGRYCAYLSTWDIARLANNASMDGRGYGCKVRPDDNRSLGASLCVS